MRMVFWLGVVTVIFFLTAAVLVPYSDTLKAIVAAPAVAGLSGALFQIFRDYFANLQKRDLQRGKQSFELGTTSHMANVVFDKHTSFCEKYLAEVHALVTTLTREGPTSNALDHAGKLLSLRIEYTVWITPEIEEKLVPFENAVTTMGANAGLVRALSGEPDEHGERSKAIKEMYEILRKMLEIDEDSVKNSDAAINNVKNKVREILQVDKLISVREYLVDEAAKPTGNN